jgi:PAS domain S-box-containing protein
MQVVKERVLLVDDEPQVLLALEDLLSDRFDVVKTTSAEEALTIAQSERDIAVVISDQRMPRMNGDELLAVLSQSSPAVRILVTGFADLSAVARAVNDGRIFAYVAKPWNGEDLHFKVQTAAEQFRSSRALVSERQLLHDLMDNIPDGIYFKDRHLRFVRVNRAYANMIGQPLCEGIVGKKLGALEGVPDHSHDVEQEELGVIANGTSIIGIVREYCDAGGSGRFWAETKAAIRNAGGEAIGLVGIVRDVTEQRALEMHLAQSQKMDAIGRFAGGIAHDFNNLLAVILSYAEFIQTQIVDQERVHDDCMEVINAANRAASLTRQLLAFSRQQVIQPRAFRANEVVVNVEKMLRRIIGKDIQLKVHAPETGLIVADPSQLEQIILNLVVNARDAMPSGGKLVIETANVTLDQTYTEQHPGVEPGAFVAVTVTDTGCGMDKPTLKRIFEPFFTTKELGKGTGLGLATVHGIVTQGGGHLSVYSEVGAGTSFKAYFRRVNDDAAPLVEASEISELAPSVATVLILEDDDAVRRVANRILAMQGYTVIEASRAAEARAACAANGSAIDLLLTDLVLPDASGVTLAEELRRAYPQLRTLFMSGYPGAAVHETRLALGQPYIEKPFTPARLAKKVREVLTSTTSLQPS